MGGLTEAGALDVRPAVEGVRQIELALGLDIGDFAPPAVAVAAWLDAFDDWFRSAIADAPGPRGNAQLLYRRTTVLTTATGPDHWPCIGEISRTAAACGIAFETTIQLTGGEDDGDVDALARLEGLAGVRVRAPDGDDPRWLGLVERIAAAGLGLTFIGPPARFRALELTRSDVLATRAYRIRPTGQRSVAGLKMAADGSVFASGSPVAIGHVSRAPGPDFLRR